MNIVRAKGKGQRAEAEGTRQREKGEGTGQREKGAYSLLLHLYPKSFRNEYGEELRRVFERRRRDASGAVGRAALWVGEIIDTIASATRVHADILRQDLRHTRRSLIRSRGFAAAAIIVTALGVGATTAVFSVADHVLIRPLPFPEPDRIVKIWQSQPGYPKMEAAPANYRDWKDMSSSFARMGAFSGGVSFSLVGAGDPVRLEGAWVTGDLMQTLGVQPAFGRLIDVADDAPDGPSTVVISSRLWRSQFGADPAILGRQLNLGGQMFAVVGVMPDSFLFPTRLTDLWAPAQMGPALMAQRDNYFLQVVGRLKPGVSRDAASAELSSIAAKLAALYPKSNANVGTVMIDFRQDISWRSRSLLYALVGAAACILLIACSNLASLLMARASARERELSVRAALGAGRERLVRQLMTESLSVAVAGGVLGLLLAIAAVPLIVRLVPTGLPIAEVPGLNARLLVIAAMVTLATGIGFGVLPALRAGRQSASLRDGARAGVSRRTERIRGALVIMQVAASVVLLVGAGLLMRALWNVQGMNLGIRPQGVLTMRTELPVPKYAPQTARVAFYDHVIEKVRALPGVESAAYTSWLPMTFRGGIWPVFFPGQPRDTTAGPTVSIRFVTDDYFKVMGMPVVAGRGFDASDSINAEKTVVVSQSFVDRHWPGQDPRGQRFFVNFFDRVVVGVVGDVKVRGPERESEPQVYFSYRQQPDNSMTFYSPKDLVVKMRATSEAQEAALAPAIRQIIAKADPELPVSDVRALSAIVAGETAERKTQVRVLGVFAGLACLLAAIGLNGLLAFVVAARTREIGVRLALGASPRQVLVQITGRGMLLALAGVIAGVGAAYLAGRSLQAILAGVSPADAVAVAGAVGVSLVSAAAGILLPALRASRTSPTEALRAD
jgi:predicted permease